MASLPKRIFVIGLLAVLASPSFAGKGVGISGPDQIFTLERGTNLTSYVRVYNTGDERSTYLLNLTGNATAFMSLQALELTLDPGENAKVGIVYRVPVDAIPGVYSGSILATVAGQAVSPGVAKEVRIIVGGGYNQRPMVAFLSPRQDKVSGKVDIVIQAWDPEGAKLDLSILVDGTMLASSATCLWDTTREKNGWHVLEVRASDGVNVAIAQLSVQVVNPLPFDWLWIVGPILLFTLILVVAAASARRRARAGRHAKKGPTRI